MRDFPYESLRKAAEEGAAQFREILRANPMEFHVVVMGCILPLFLSKEPGAGLLLSLASIGWNTIVEGERCPAEADKSAEAGGRVGGEDKGPQNDVKAGAP